jgi:hypothetical protein
MAKALTRDTVKRFTDIPNIGKAMAGDFELMGIHDPRELERMDPLKMYQDLCKKMGQRLDPCVLDVFMAAVDFMSGGKARPWWEYTPLRKRQYKI